MSNGDCGVAITNISLYCCLWLQWSFVVTIARHLARLLWALLTPKRSIITYFTIFWSYSQFVSRSCYDQAVHHTNWPLARWQYFMQMLNFNLYGKKWNFLLLLLLLVFRFSFFFSSLSLRWHNTQLPCSACRQLLFGRTFSPSAIPSSAFLSPLSCSASLWILLALGCRIHRHYNIF